MDVKSSFSGNGNSLRLLKILVGVSPAVFIVLLALFRGSILQGATPTVMDGLFFASVATFSVLFYVAVFRLIKRTGEEKLQHKRDLAILNEIALTVNESLDLKVMLPHAMEKLIQLTMADSGQLALINEENSEPSYTLSVGIPIEAFTPTSSSSSDGEAIISEASRLNEPIIIQDTKGSESPFAPALWLAGFRSLAVVPIKSRTGIVGVFSLVSYQPHHFKSNEVGLLANIGNQMAVAIENARLHEKVQGVVISEERDRIAKELHDGLAQVLGYVITKSQATRQILNKITEANEYLVELENVAQDVYTDTREDILGLRTAVSGDQKMVSAISEYLARFSQMHDIRTELKVGDQAIPRLSPQVELQALRIVQEALSNIRKHAQATLALVKVTTSENEVTLIVEDDGKGFNIGDIERTSASKFGIRTIKERAESIHARLDIESQSGHGTRVTLDIPVP